MRDPSQPDTQQNEYIPEAPNAHKGGLPHAEPENVNPRNPSSMPRAEDDLETQASSPEFHDRIDVPQGGSGSTIPLPHRDE